MIFRGQRRIGGPDPFQSPLVLTFPLRGCQKIRVKFFFTILIAISIAGCATFTKEQSHLYRHYKGAIRPNSDIAIVKSITMAQTEKLPSDMLAVELHKIDEVEFKQQGGFGNSIYELHFWPGEYRLRLRLAEATAAEFKDLELHEVEFPLSAEKGHRYILGGEMFTDPETGKLQWRPVVFDQTRVIGWQRRSNEKEPSKNQGQSGEEGEPQS